MRNFHLLARRNFRLLWVGGFISVVGDWVFRIGLPISIYQLTGSALATTAMFVAAIVPSIVFGTVAGVYVDRWDRRRTLIVGNVLLALVLVPLVFVRDAREIWVIYLVQFVASTLVLLVAPASGALLPRLVESDDLIAANSLNGLNNNLSRIIGPPLGGLIAVTSGIVGIAVVDAATFVVAAGSIALMRDAPITTKAAATVADGGRAWRRLWRDWLAGLRVVRARRAVATIFALISIVSLGEGVFSVLFILYVVDVLRAGPPQLGLLQSMQGLGSIIGALALVALSTRVGPAALIGWSALLFGAVDLAIFNAPALGAAFALIAALFVIVGVPGGMTFPTVFGVVQTAVPDAYRGRVISAMYTTSALLQLIGLVLAGVLVGPLGTVTLLNIQGLGYVVAGAAMLVLLPRAFDADRRGPIAIAS